MTQLIPLRKQIMIGSSTQVKSLALHRSKASSAMVMNLKTRVFNYRCQETDRYGGNSLLIAYFFFFSMKWEARGEDVGE